MNALAIRNEDEMEQWKVIRDQATVLIKSGFLPQSIKTPEQALAIILTGREIGIGTMAALNTINVIAGKPTISPQLMLALINRTGQLEDMLITDDGQCCAVTMRRKGRQPHSEAFSMKDAALMKTQEYIGGEKKTISLSEKYNWKQMPAVMRKWRAVAACARVVFPDVILGLYTPEEMGAQVSEEGEVIDIQPEPTTPLSDLDRTCALEDGPEPGIVRPIRETEPTEDKPAMALADEKPDTPDAELRWLAWKLGYTDQALVKWLTKKYGLDEGITINTALMSLGDGELQFAIGMFQAHLKAKQEAEAKEQAEAKGATQ